MAICHTLTTYRDKYNTTSYAALYYYIVKMWNHRNSSCKGTL